jgi:hypothetical protein
MATEPKPSSARADSVRSAYRGPATVPNRPGQRGLNRLGRPQDAARDCAQRAPGVARSAPGVLRAPVVAQLMAVHQWLPNSQATHRCCPKRWGVAQHGVAQSGGHGQTTSRST